MVGCHHEEEEPVYAFTVGEKNEEKIGVNVGGCKLNMIIDSGASTNIQANMGVVEEKQSEVRISTLELETLCLCIPDTT